MTWLSFCARRPGPEWKTGYPGVPSRTLGEIEGVVDHSMEGSLAASYAVLDGPRQASWTFSLPKVGEPVQHYPLEKIPWHAGLPGDRRQDTSLIGNLTLVGKEVEGVAGEAWTENQLHWSAKIDVALRALCPSFGANPPTLRKNMWEHNWLTATSCPSGRNPWNAKFALINALEVRDMAKFIESPDGKLYLTDGVFRNHIPEGSGRINDAKKLFGNPVKVGQAFVNDLRTSGPILSAGQIREIVRKELDRETKAV